MSSRVFELDVSGAKRLLFVSSEERIQLLDVGGKEIVPRYTERMLENDLTSLKPASDVWASKPLIRVFDPIPDRTVGDTFPEEASEEWLYFLDDAQGKIFEELFDGVYNSLQAGDSKFKALIIGGPGTGKTCILVNLLSYFTEFDISTAFVVSDSLSEFYEGAMQVDVRKFVVPIENAHLTACQILLVDDPDTTASIRKLSTNSSVQAFIAAFDPLQMNVDPTDEELDILADGLNAKTHELGICYRQKENVGKTARQVMNTVARSSPFLIDSRIARFRDQRRRITSLSNEIQFTNPHGYSQIYDPASLEDVEEEVERILHQRWRFWSHFASNLVVILGESLRVSVQKVLQPLKAGGQLITIRQDELERVKGLEFQHVLVFLRDQLHQELTEGFQGSGRRIYRQRTRFRIPFTRAKDSIALFVAGKDLLWR